MPARALASPWRRRRPAPGPVVPPAPAAPDAPSSPDPADAATAYYTRLSWVSARATKFDVYLDTVNPPTTIVAPKYNTTTYVPTLAPGTTYYWKIVAFNDGGSAAGPVWSFTTPAATAVLFSLAGAIVTTHARFGTLSIRETLGASPNTASVIFDTSPPAGGEAVAIGLGTLDTDHLIFGGEVQGVDQTCVGLPGASSLYPLTLIDQTFRLNKRRPFGTWTNVSASTIARYLVATFAPPGFTSTHVADNLPAVSIVFDGSQDFMSCLRSLATAISTATAAGKTKVDYAKDVWLYLTYTGEQPDPLNAAHPPLQLPSPIRFSVDHSQLRTRCFGKGHGERLLADVAAGETILPIADTVMFTPTGGQAIASTTADGAQGQILTYAGVQAGGGGSLAGPGAAPSTAPAVARASGTELGAGVYKYAYTDATAAGESLPSPLAAIVTGDAAAPGGGGAGVAVGTPTAGGSVDLGTHDYVLTFVTAIGETTPSAASGSATSSNVATPGAMTNNRQSGQGSSNLSIGDTVFYVCTWTNSAGQTTAGAASNSVTITGIDINGTIFAQGTFVDYPALGAGATGRRIYRNRNGSYDNAATFGTSAAGTYPDNGLNWNLGNIGAPPGTNTAAIRTIPLTILTSGDSNVTSRKIYRRFNGSGNYNLVATVADNVTTTYTDTTANASLGAAAPSTNTAAERRVQLTGIAVGASGTTSRKVYRTAVGGTQLKLLTTLADNATTTFLDATVDGALGANAPTGDTSGLTQAAGQTLAGSTSLPTASAAPFDAAIGGWATCGQQTFRYTGVSANTLTGIPASGPGALATTVLNGSQVLPAPALIGINNANGVALAMAKGSAVNIWVQRDDLGAQAALGLLERDEAGTVTDGIREYVLSDERSTEARMIALCDADLAIFSRPIVTAKYYTRDSKSKTGRTVSIALTDAAANPWAQTGDFTLQSVELSFDGPALNPLYAVTATSVAFTLGDLLRRVALTV
jgi:hypothetical protein